MYNQIAPAGSNYGELYGDNGQVYQPPVASAPPDDRNGPNAPLYPNVPHPSYYAAVPQQNFPSAPHLQPNSQAVYISQAVHSSTMALLRIASGQANAILGKKREDLNSYNQYAAQQSSPQYAAPHSGSHQPAYARSFAPVTVVRQSSYVDNSWNTINIGSDRTVHHHHHHGRPVDNRRGQQRDNNDAIRIGFGLVSMVVIFVGAYFAGQAMAAGEDAHEEAQSYNDLKARWNFNMHSVRANKESYPAEYALHVDNIITRVDSIFARQRTNRMQNLALLIGTLAAAGAAFGGAVVGSGAWMAAGTLIGAGVLGLGIIKLGYRCVSQGATRDAWAIERQFEDLNRFEQQNPLLIEG